MVSFKKHITKQKTTDVSNLIDLFNSLDRHTTHTDLRPVQEQALSLLTDRRDEKDLILKLSTGTGKTAIGLLYLLSHMEEKEEPVLYLCPTVQLVGQVLEEAIKLGVKANFYPANERYPETEGTRGKSIIVCTYAKLFNARSTFDRDDVKLRPYAIVLDDVHAGIEDIRDRFTLRLNTSNGAKELMNLLSDPCKSYQAGLWQNIMDGDPLWTFEVPFWIWNPLVPEILKLLSPSSNEDHFIFVWPFLRDNLKNCRCIITAKSVEIIPDILPIEKCQAFYGAKKRLFMSGTLADDSVLVREIGVRLEAAQKPIIPQKDYGLGERMIIAPVLFSKNLDRNYVMSLSKRLSSKFNVVIICPSESRARDWEKVEAKVFLGDDVSSAVRELKSSKNNLMVFIQRYDGIDLPDNACRILVIDGMPIGEAIIDKHDRSLKAVPGGMRNKIVYRIEQGMGRPIRSHVDYAIIILSGADLANFIAKKEVLSAMNPQTKLQLQLALDLAELAKEDTPKEPQKAMESMIVQCLKRDDDWKQYYDEKVRRVKFDINSIPQYKLEMASLERDAFCCSTANDYTKAIEQIQNGLNKHNLMGEERGWYLQKIAIYTYEIDPAKSLEIQSAAYQLNNLLFHPPKVKPRTMALSEIIIPNIILSWFNQFDNPNGTIAAIQDLRARLSFDVSANTMEQALFELTPLLGIQGSRPEIEYGEGPDNLWLWPSLSIVAEAKNQNKKSLHKKDASQLLNSIEWFKKNHPTRTEGMRPIVVAKLNIADEKSGFPTNTRILTPEKMAILLDNLEKFYQTLIQGMPLSLKPKKINELLHQFELSPEHFLSNYTVKIKQL